jgi:drug/metabolite transporter (DMT)-like permease
MLATLGTSAVVYGSSTSPTNNKPGDEGVSSTGISLKPTAPLLGNLLTLVASFGYGLYQVLYKIYAALPSDPEAAELLYEQISGEEEEEGLRSSANGTYPMDSEMVYPPPFGLYPNLLTSMLGLSTLVVLWLPIPFLHWSGAEPFRLPSNFTTFLAISGIALTGVVFNAGFMVCF